MRPDLEDAYRQPELLYDMDADEDSQCVYHFVSTHEDDENEEGRGKKIVHKEMEEVEGKGKEKITADIVAKESWTSRSKRDELEEEDEEQRELLIPNRGEEVEVEASGASEDTRASLESSEGTAEREDGVTADTTGHANVVQTVGGWNPFKVRGIWLIFSVYPHFFCVCFQQKLCRLLCLSNK